MKISEIKPKVYLQSSPSPDCLVYGTIEVPTHKPYSFDINISNWIIEGIDLAEQNQRIEPLYTSAARYYWGDLPYNITGFGRPKYGKEEKGSGDNLFIGWTLDKNLTNLYMLIVLWDSLSKYADDSYTSLFIAEWLKNNYPDYMINDYIQKAHEEYTATQSKYSGYASIESIANRLKKHDTPNLGKAIYGMAGIHMRQTANNNFAILAGSGDMGIFGQDIPNFGKKVKILPQGYAQIQLLDQTELEATETYGIKIPNGEGQPLFDFVGNVDKTSTDRVCIDYTGPNFTCMPFPLQGTRFAMMSDGTYRYSPYTNMFRNQQDYIFDTWLFDEYQRFVANVEDGIPALDDESALGFVAE